ncbi:MAG: nuclear transport factor 2 family protein [Candidatus Competibacteraceae bacterium]
MNTSQNNAAQFFENHLNLIAAGKIDEMVDHDYTEDAILITFFNGFKDMPPPIAISGRQAIKDFFRRYMTVIGKINIKTIICSHENYKAEGKGAVLFQAEFECDLGLMKVGDGWEIRDGKIATHFGFWASEPSY